MKKYTLGIIAMVVLISCLNKKGAVMPASVKTENSTLQITVLNTNGAESDGLITLQASIFLKKETLDQDKTLPIQLQFGVDSSFYLIGQKDTIWPAYVMPVANGQPLKPQFIIAFNRHDVKGASQVLLKSRLWQNRLFDSSVQLNLKNY